MSSHAQIGHDPVGCSDALHKVPSANVHPCPSKSALLGYIHPVTYIAFPRCQPGHPSALQRFSPCNPPCPALLSLSSFGSSTTPMLLLPATDGKSRASPPEPRPRAPRLGSSIQALPRINIVTASTYPRNRRRRTVAVAHSQSRRWFLQPLPISNSQSSCYRHTGEPCHCHRHVALPLPVSCFQYNIPSVRVLQTICVHFPHLLFLSSLF
jgi:hypothetical protein